MTQPPFPPAGGGAPAGYASSEEKTWALVAHFGAIVFGFLAPLLVFLVKGSQSSTVRAHAVAALNFQIVCSGTLLGLAILRGCVGFAGIGFLGWMLSLASTAVWLASAIFALLGGLRANEGQVYRYPVQANLVR